MELHPLSKPQTSIWNMEQYFGGSIANITGSAMFNEWVDVHDLQSALNKTVAQCDSLRIRIKMLKGTPMQYISEFVQRDFGVVSFSTQNEFSKWLDVLAKTPFDFNDDLYKMFIIEISGKIGFVLHLHHLTADAWMLNLLADSILMNIKGDPVHIASYLDYIDGEREYENSARRIKDQEYFLSCFEKCGEPVYLSDRQSKNTVANRLSLTINTADATKIQAFCADNDLSPYALFMNALAVYIYRIKGTRDFYIGTTAINRSGKREKETAGMFINTVPVLFHIDESKSVLENSLENTNAIRGVFRRQKYQYGDLLKDIREKYGFTGRLYDVSLQYQNAALSSGSIDTQWHFCGCQGESLNIHINDRQNEGVFHLDYDYQTELFSRSDIERLHGHLMNVIFDGIANPQNMPQKLKLLSAGEYQQVTADFNDTSEDFPQNKCVHQLFEERARQKPDDVALIACDETLTFGKLNYNANRIAHALIEKGITTSDVVAILLPRRSSLVAAMLGILKSGGAYMPLDPCYPADRIGFMLKDSGTKAVITTRDFAHKIEQEALIIEDVLSFNDTSNPNIFINPQSLFCVLHTSGSTGMPKIAALMHKNIINFANATQHMFGHATNAISATIVSFDMFMQETLLPLCRGIRVILLNENEISNQVLFENKLEEYADCFILQTPTKLENYISNSKTKAFMKHINTLVIGGEVFPPHLYSMIRQYTISEILEPMREINMGSQIRVFNGYGPVETTLGVSYVELLSSDITIGKPISNTQIYILDKHLYPLPIGATGELCIAGADVGCGYLNRPKLTAEKFVDNPFGSGKMYRSGDYAKWREDGNIEFVGRIDNQIKIRGLRIELGEIEAIISQCEGIEQIAMAVKCDERGRQYLCAYYAGKNADVKAVRETVAKKLPQYMMPHFFVSMENFPMTASGKTDRKALPEPDFSNIESDTEYAAPITQDEKAIVRLMQKVLNVQRIGLNDNFFDLGGDSLKAIEFISKAHYDGMYFSLQDVFDYPCAALLVKHITEGNHPKAQYQSDYFVPFHQLLSKNIISGKSARAKQTIGDVLITGATGWLGAHVLDEFLSNERGIAYCLVRGADAEDSRSRLNVTLKNFFDGKYYGCDRIITVCGDIAENIVFDKKVDAIIHCAANVKHYGSYQHSYNINVGGTRNIIKLAIEKSARLLHISTASISGNGFDITPGFPLSIFDETKLYIGQPLDNVYAKSKFEAETAVLDARINGLDAVVIRVGNLTNRRSDLKFQQNYGENAILTRLKAFVDLGMYPEQLNNTPLEFSPVDDTARAIIRLAQCAGSEYSVFHAYHPKPILFSEFIKALRTAGLKMKAVSMKDFIDIVRNSGNIQGKEHIHEAFIHDIGLGGVLRFQPNILLNNDFTVWYLDQIGFMWPDVANGYLEKYVGYLIRIN